MKRKLFLLLSALFLLSVFVPPASWSQSLSYTVKKGFKGMFKAEFFGEGQAGIEGKLVPFNVNGSMDLVAEVLSVDSDGTFDLVLLPKNAVLSVKPFGAIQLPEKPGGIYIVERISRQGRLVAVQGMDAIPTQTEQDITLKMIVDDILFLQLIFPDRAVKKGDTWETSVDRPPHRPVTIKYTYARDDKWKDQTVAVIEAQLAHPTSTLTIVPTGDYNPIRGKVVTQPTFYFSKKLGTIVKYDITFKTTELGLVTDHSANTVDVKVYRREFSGSAKLEME